ncbi:MAG: choice-of-anchor Q domain-containing protein, partial [Acidimicrobiales bacterium]
MRIIGAALAALLVGAAGLVGAAPASAVNAVITVTTTADVVNGSDGVLSLREAVMKADTDAGADTIQLASSATYDLTICGPSEPSVLSPDPSVGDLDATDAAGLTILGSGSTIHQTCTARVVQSSAGSLDLSTLSLVGGTAANGASVRGGGPLTLTSVDVSGSVLDAPVEQADGAVVGVAVPVLITSSVIHDNSATGVACNVPSSTGPTAADCAIDGSTIRDNTSSVGIAGGITSFNGVAVTGSSVTGNALLSEGGAGGIFAGHDGEIDSSEISGNTGPTGGLWGIVHLDDSTVADNVGTSVGGVSGELHLLRSTLADNVGKVAGGFLGGSSLNTATESTISGNRAEDPVTHDPGVGGGVVLTGTFGLTLTNSTMTANRGAVAGGIVAQGADGAPTYPGNTVKLVSSTIVGDVNTGGPAGTTTSEIAFLNLHNFTSGTYGTLDTQASTIGAATHGAGRVCAMGGTMSGLVSRGYNVVADDSCLFSSTSPVTGDLWSNGDPGLTTLGDHGGSTATMIPVIGSPLLDRIPIGPKCPATDQRGVSRPSGSACDVGAVEANSVAFPDGDPYTPVAPVRLLDSRNPSIGTAWAFAPLTLPIAGTHGVPADATAVVVNVTGTDVTVPTFYTIYPSVSGPPPNASNVNLAAGQTAANLVTVRLGGDGAIKLANANGLPQVIVDLMGYYAPAPEGTSTYSSIAPERLADSRDHTVLQTFAPHSVQSLVVAGGSTPVPDDASAVVVNLTATDVTAPTFLTAYPKGAPSVPNVSNLNLAFHETRANLAIVKVGADHSISLFNDSGTANVIVDVVGYFTTDDTHADF